MSAGEGKRKALGRGLETLLPARAAHAPAGQEKGEAQRNEAAAASEAGRPLELAVEKIERNPFQTRSKFDDAALAELATSIAATGVVQPIVVRPLAGGKYQLIAGERRLLASQRVGKSTIPAIVRQASDRQTLEMTIVENLQRADLNPMEQARAYQRLGAEFHLTQEQMAQRTGKERASVANFLRLLRLPQGVQHMVEAGDLSFGHARCLLALEEEERISAAAGRVKEQALSVRQTEALVQSLLRPPAAQTRDKAKKPQDPNVHDAALSLQRRLGLKVTIEDKKGKGRVIIEYAKLEDFDHLLAALGAE